MSLSPNFQLLANSARMAVSRMAHGGSPKHHDVKTTPPTPIMQNNRGASNEVNVQNMPN